MAAESKPPSPLDDTWSVLALPPQAAVSHFRVMEAIRTLPPHPETGVRSMSQDRLAAAAGLHLDTFKDSRRDLAEWGAITYTPGRGRGSYGEYVIVVVPPLEKDAPAGKGGRDVPPFKVPGKGGAHESKRGVPGKLKGGSDNLPVPAQVSVPQEEVPQESVAEAPGPEEDLSWILTPAVPAEAGPGKKPSAAPDIPPSAAPAPAPARWTDEDREAALAQVFARGSMVGRLAPQEAARFAETAFKLWPSAEPLCVARGVRDWIAEKNPRPGVEHVPSYVRKCRKDISLYVEAAIAEAEEKCKLAAQRAAYTEAQHRREEEAARREEQERAQRQAAGYVFAWDIEHSGHWARWEPQAECVQVPPPPFAPWYYEAAGLPEGSPVWVRQADERRYRMAVLRENLPLTETEGAELAARLDLGGRPPSSSAGAAQPAAVAADVPTESTAPGCGHCGQPAHGLYALSVPGQQTTQHELCRGCATLPVHNGWQVSLVALLGEEAS